VKAKRESRNEMRHEGLYGRTGFALMVGGGELV